MSKPTKRQPSLEFRKFALRELTNQIGVYELNLDRIPIYVEQRIDGIRARVNRHLTSARSDIITNRELTFWETAYVKAWARQAEGRHSASRRGSLQGL